jgi:hypothetical protein
VYPAPRLAHLGTPQVGLALSLSDEKVTLMPTADRRGSAFTARHQAVLLVASPARAAANRSDPITWTTRSGLSAGYGL